VKESTEQVTLKEEKEMEREMRGGEGGDSEEEGKPRNGTPQAGEEGEETRRKEAVNGIRGVEAEEEEQGGGGR
jgi:hypothetical protein